MQRRPVDTFEDLLVWQKGIQLVKDVYLATRQGDLAEDRGLRDQLQRAAVSIPTNIAEGFERASRKEYLQYLNFAKGSAGEVRSLLRVALEIGCLGQSSHDLLRDSVLELRRYISNQIRSLRQTT